MRLYGIILGILMLSLLSACSNDAEPGGVLEPESRLGRPLLEFVLNDIQHDGDTFSYEFQRETTESGHIDRTVEYTKTDDAYQGKLILTFSSKEKSHIEVIPKSFARHVDQLEFSIEPSRIINPDPEVEFSNVEGEVEISSKESVEEEELELTLEEQVIKGELDTCGRLKTEFEIYGCALRVISKYRKSEALKEEFSDMDIGELREAVFVAVYKQELRTCKEVTVSEDKAKCYEFSYQILVEECNVLTGKEYRDCVRNQGWRLPIGMRKSLCQYVDDKDMHDECSGVADISVCDEIESDELRVKCQINIARTKGSIDLCSQVDLNHGPDICYAFLGADKNDVKYCKLIGDEADQGDCILRIAVVNDDKALCDTITDQESKELCLSHFFIGHDPVTKEMCAKITDNEVLRDNCDLMLAVQEKNTEKCEAYADEDDTNKPLCYFAIAFTHKDEELCPKIMTKGGPELVKLEKQMKDACYFDIAINKSKILLCKKIEDAEGQKECLGELEESSVPDEPPISVPAWMDCPIPKGAQLREWNQAQTSGFEYQSADSMMRHHGPYVKYAGRDYKYPYQFYCYDKDSKKHGKFKEYYQKKDILKIEGTYSHGEYDGVIKKYSICDGVQCLTELTTYKNGRKDGYAEEYYYNGDLIGTIKQKGYYVDGSRDGEWESYDDNGKLKGTIIYHGATSEFIPLDE